MLPHDDTAANVSSVGTSPAGHHQSGSLCWSLLAIARSRVSCNVFTAASAPLGRGCLPAMRIDVVPAGRQMIHHGEQAIRVRRQIQRTISAFLLRHMVDGSLPAQPALRQCRHRRQASRAPVAVDGRRRETLQRRHRDLAMGEQRPTERSGCGDGLCGDVPRSKRWRPCPSCGSILPALKIRVVNVVDLMKLQPDTEHPHGLSDFDFDSLFTTTSR